MAATILTLPITSQAGVNSRLKTAQSLSVYNGIDAFGALAWSTTAASPARATSSLHVRGIAGLQSAGAAGPVQYRVQIDGVLVPTSAGSVNVQTLNDVANYVGEGLAAGAPIGAHVITLEANPVGGGNSIVSGSLYCAEVRS
jgi:hypothetical protein